MNYKQPSNWTDADKDHVAGVAMLHHLHHPDWCAWCDTSGAEYLCGGCHLSSYCSIACMENDWVDRHHILCPLMKNAMNDEGKTRQSTGASSNAASSSGRGSAQSVANEITVYGSGTGSSSPLSVATNSKNNGSSKARKGRKSSKARKSRKARKARKSKKANTRRRI